MRTKADVADMILMTIMIAMAFVVFACGAKPTPDPEKGFTVQGKSIKVEVLKKK